MQCECATRRDKQKHAQIHDQRDKIHWNPSAVTIYATLLVSRISISSAQFSVVAWISTWTRLTLAVVLSFRSLPYIDYQCICSFVCLFVVRALSMCILFYIHKCVCIFFYTLHACDFVHFYSFYSIILSHSVRWARAYDQINCSSLSSAK